MNKVKTLLEAGEVSRAAQAVWGRAQAVEGREVRAAFEKTQMAATDEGRLTVDATELRPASQELLGKIANRLAGSFHKFPRKSGTGPASSRYEHWAGLQHDEQGAKTVSRTLVRLLGSGHDIPRAARDALLSAVRNGIPKKGNKGTRVL